MGTFLKKLGLAVLLGTLATVTVPHRIAGWEADAWFEGDVALETLKLTPPRAP